MLGLGVAEKDEDIALPAPAILIAKVSEADTLAPRQQIHLTAVDLRRQNRRKRNITCSKSKRKNSETNGNCQPS